MPALDTYHVIAKYYDGAYAAKQDLVDLPFYLDLAEQNPAARSWKSPAAPAASSSPSLAKALRSAESTTRDRCSMS